MRSTKFVVQIVFGGPAESPARRIWPGRMIDGERTACKWEFANAKTEELHLKQIKIIKFK